MDTVLLLAFASLAGADLGLSMACVTDGACVEVNPLLAPLQDHPGAYGAVKAGVTAGAVMGIWKATRHKPRARLAALAGMVCVQAIVVGINAQRLRGR